MTVFPSLPDSLNTTFDVNAQKYDPDRVIRVGRAREYPKQVWYFIASFIALVSLCHFVSVFASYLRTRRRPVDRLAPYDGTGPLLWRRLPIALVNLFRVVAFRWPIPIPLYPGGSSVNIAETFLTAAYAATVFTWSLINSTSTIGVRFDPKYWANIAGNIGGSQLALMTALGMKNNIISYLTGVGFDKLNYLHRMSARIICILFWVHGSGRLMLGLAGAVTIDHPWVQAGYLSTVALSILSLFAIRPLRDAGYEIFKIAHLLLGILFILSAYFHANGLDDGQYVWPTILIWGLDRFLRLVRIGLFSWQAKSEVDVLSPHFVRINVSLGTKGMKFSWRPGQSVYLSFLDIGIGQAHPFTVCDVDAQGRLVFLVRVRAGITKKLLAESEGKKTSVILDGPYSSPPLLWGYQSIVLISGGSGVAFTLPLFLDMIRRAKNGESACNRLLFVWAIREPDHANWIKDSIDKALENLPDFMEAVIRFCVTGTDQAWDDDSANEEEFDRGSPVSSEKANEDVDVDKDKVNIEKGRPDLGALLRQEMKEVGIGGAMSVNVCGTPALSSAVRSALNAPRFVDILRGGASVSLHVEGFGSG